jgi:hypothetical protein
MWITSAMPQIVALEVNVVVVRQRPGQREFEGVHMVQENLEVEAGGFADDKAEADFLAPGRIGVGLSKCCPGQPDQQHDRHDCKRGLADHGISSTGTAWLKPLY